MNRPTLASQPPAPPRPAGRPAEPRVPAPPSPSRPPPATRVLRALAALASAWWLSMPAGAAPASAAQPASAPVSATAKQVFERSKGQLLQIRTLLKTQDSQASVGSGFLVDDRLTLADIAVASPFVNFEHLGIKVDSKTHPKTAAFVEKLEIVDRKRILELEPTINPNIIAALYCPTVGIASPYEVGFLKV